HLGSGAVSDNRAPVVENAAQNYRGGDPECSQGDREKPAAGEDARQHGAEQRKAGDAKGCRAKSDQDREGDLSAQAACQPPKAPVEIHQRTFSSEWAARSASPSVRGSSTSTVRCSVGRGVAVTMLTPSGAENRCHAPCGTTTVMPAVSAWVS